MVNFLRRSGDLFLAVLLTALAFTAAAGNWPAGLRIPLSLAVCLLLPGYAFLAALYPGRGSLSGQQRLLLSVCFSWAIIPILALVMNYIWSLEMAPVMGAVVVFVTGISVIAYCRRGWQPALDNDDNSIEDFGIPGFISTLVLWVILAVLTTLLMAFPVSLKLEITAIQSLNIFSGNFVFILLFLPWMGILLYLLFGHRRTGDWGRLTLIAIFALVFVDFWVVISPLGYHVDSLWHQGAVRVLQTTNTLPQVRLGYWNYPGIHMYANYLSQLTGFDLFVTVDIIRVFQNVMAAVLLFLMFSKVLNNTYLAPLAAIIAVMCMPQADHLQFIPHNFALVLLLAFLVMSTRREEDILPGPSDKIAALLLLLAVNLSSFWHTMVFGAIIAAIFAVQALRREKSVGLSFVVISAVIIIAWQGLFAGSIYRDLSLLLPELWQNISSGAFLHTAVMSAGTWGPQVPVWAVFTRYFWLFIIIGLGSFLVLMQVRRLRLLSLLEAVSAGSLVLTIFFFALVAVISREGYYATRYQEFARLFTPAVLISFFIAPSLPWQEMRSEIGVFWQRRLMAVAVGIVLILSLPTFLLVGRNISGDAFSEVDLEAMDFLESRFGQGVGLEVYSNQSFAGGIRYYAVPYAEGVGPLEPYILKTEKAIWPEMQHVVNMFTQAGDGPKVFVYSERAALGYVGWFNVAPDDQRWLDLKNRLASFVGPENTWQNAFYTIYIHP